MAIKCPPTPVLKNFMLCGLILLIIPTCESQLSTQEILLRFTRHMDAMKKFPCEVPQPRSISVEELLGDQLDTSESAQPHTTVLHRCDSGTGCCSQKSQVCKVAQSEEVELHFFVTDTVRQRKSQFREFVVSNHTRCSCQSKKNDIK
ncbi:hypothetical protein RN001_009325 [Aquatica leii]|uniref:Platelet-derived growth factor (PDGF) family profile domain-containing protein n=1 Tax=Aquatica leii TaxID=1421715 RepID=A0AAN7P4G4_9COLE|nr:hypothetical protein RN001_009325 [Aquatica leii]